LTGFDSKFLNTLYVDKKLKYHGLIQAFSRTNRVLNDTKPYGNIIDYRQQQDKVEEAIKRFSVKGQEGREKEIWLVDPAPEVVKKLDNAVKQLDTFMESQGLENKPENVHNLKGDVARSQFINLFKEIQRCKTQLDQYTDLEEEQKQQIETILPNEQLLGFKGVYFTVAERLKERREKEGENAPQEIQNLDFEYVLFASEIIDYDYIMRLIADYTSRVPSKHKMTRQELIGLIMSDAKFINEREDIEAYINTLTEGEALSETQIREGYRNFKAHKQASELENIAQNHNLDTASLQEFVDVILKRMIFDDEALTQLLEPLALGWKSRTQKKLAIMEDLRPILEKRAGGRNISGLESYE
jgi:type I restriction enzyme R subunit